MLCSRSLHHLWLKFPALLHVSAAGPGDGVAGDGCLLEGCLMFKAIECCPWSGFPAFARDVSRWDEKSERGLLITCPRAPGACLEPLEPDWQSHRALTVENELFRCYNLNIIMVYEAAGVPQNQDPGAKLRTLHQWLLSVLISVCFSFYMRKLRWQWIVTTCLPAYRARWVAFQLRVGFTLCFLLAEC